MSITRKIWRAQEKKQKKEDRRFRLRRCSTQPHTGRTHSLEEAFPIGGKNIFSAAWLRCPQ